LWRSHLVAEGKPLNAISEEQQLIAIRQRFGDDWREAERAVRYSIERGARNLILNGDHKEAGKSSSLDEVLNSVDYGD